METPHGVQPNQNTFRYDIPRVVRNWAKEDCHSNHQSAGADLSHLFLAPPSGMPIKVLSLDPHRKKLLRKRASYAASGETEIRNSSA